MALKFRFSLGSPQGPRATGFDLGHILVRGDDGDVGSDGRTPSQAFMLYASLPLLLSGVSSLCRAGSGSAFVFEGMDSSFSLEFRWVGRGRIQIGGGRVSVGVVTTRELLSALKKGVDDLTDSSFDLPPDDPVFEDFVGARQALAGAINQLGERSE